MCLPAGLISEFAWPMCGTAQARVSGWLASMLCRRRTGTTEKAGKVEVVAVQLSAMGSAMGIGV